MTALDIIGDVHGRKAALEDLLARMGYQPEKGIWRHSGRKAVFIGDLVDRGEDVPGTLALVKAMEDAGEARVLLGNHEFNLLCWYTPDGKGGHLRNQKNPRNAEQIASSRPLFDANTSESATYLDWFRSMPVSLEHGGARFIHAYWGRAELDVLAGRNNLDACAWGDPDWRRTPLGKALERLIKGPEFPLPNGSCIVDRGGSARTMARAAWWKDVNGKSIREMVVPHTPELPGEPLTAEGVACFEPYGPHEPPVFIGHYGFREFPGLLAPNVACVDYGVRNRETIGAYRWDGERQLREESFVR